MSRINDRNHPEYKYGVDVSATGSNRPQRNMAEKHANDQKQEEVRQGLAGLFGGGKQPQHRPIMKSLEDLGIRPHIMSVQLGSQTTTCIVVPVDELVTKEYQKLSGIDMNVYSQTNQPEQGNESDQGSTEVG